MNPGPYVSTRRILWQINNATVLPRSRVYRVEAKRASCRANGFYYHTLLQHRSWLPWQNEISHAQRVSRVNGSRLQCEARTACRVSVRYLHYSNGKQRAQQREQYRPWKHVQLCSIK